MEYKFILLLILGAAAIQESVTSGVYGRRRKLCPPAGNIRQPPNRKETKDQLRKLRAEMRRITVVQGPPLDAYIINYSDEHQSMYLAEGDQRLQYISGFTGTGLAVVTSNKSALWTSGLYLLQANNELSCDWILIGEEDSDITISDWLKEELPSNGRVGADPTMISNSVWEILNKDLTNKSISLAPVKTNLVDEIWTSKPQYTKREAFALGVKYAGTTWQHKVKLVRQSLKREGADALVVTALDEIAWLLNIRGHDIPYLPVLKSYLILTKDLIHLYTDSNRIGSTVMNSLGTKSCYTDPCVRVYGYDTIWSDLRTYSQIWKKVWLPSDGPLTYGVSRAIYLAVPSDKRKSKISPIMVLKAVKNPTEREGMRTAHVRDAAAVCDFMAYFESKLNKGETWTELQVAEQIDQMRREQSLSQGISFASIVAFGAHGALPHYEPMNTTAIPVDKSSLLVIDSGGHYLDGTTDITRTFHFGQPTEEQIDAYTRVLIGHINLAMLTFPSHTKVNRVDVLARAPIWETGTDYQHGTGHGIGAFLNVHEGPILMTSRSTDEEVFKDGYFFSVEPGIYKEGKFGVRLENILEVVEKESKNGSSTTFLQFRPVTLVPFERKLIDLSKLTIQHIRWLNEYNARVRDEVGAELKRQVKMKGFHWMIEKAKHIPEDCHLRGAANLNSPAFVLLITIISLWF